MIYSRMKHIKILIKKFFLDLLRRTGCRKNGREGIGGKAQDIYVFVSIATLLHQRCCKVLTRATALTIATSSLPETVDTESYCSHHRKNSFSRVV